MPELDYSAAIDRLNELITPEQIPLVDPTQPACVIGWGAMLNVQHLIHGIRVLDAGGCSHAAIPVVRTLFEYSVGVLWLADAGQDAADVLNRRLHGAQTKLNRDLEAIPRLASHGAP